MQLPVVLAAPGNWRWPLVGMLGFSLVFALGFSSALVPQPMTQSLRSGGSMNSVKVVMGFLVIVVAMKVLSNADLVWLGSIFTRTAAGETPHAPFVARRESLLCTAQPQSEIS
jgi:thiol:disulfide interchange protein DsbD